MHEANDGCGNVCREVDANVYCTAVYRAHQLIKLCETMISLWRDSEGKSTLKQRVCRRCQTTEAELKEQGLGKLKQCQRCKQSSYCSRACQVEDWKRHKPYCQERTRK